MFFSGYESKISQQDLLVFHHILSFIREYKYVSLSEVFIKAYETMIKGLQVINKVIIIPNEDINPDPIIKDDELVIMSLKESEFDKYLAIFENEKRYISDQFAFLNGYLHEDYLNDRLSLTFAIKTIENEDIIGAIKILKGEDEVDYSK